MIFFILRSKGALLYAYEYNEGRDWFILDLFHHGGSGGKASSKFGFLWIELEFSGIRALWLACRPCSIVCMNSFTLHTSFY